jgi:ssDNA-binding replication factor A large subunit
MLSAEEIISKLAANSDLSEDDIKLKINQKMESLSGLISEAGAGHIVANELGVKLFQASAGVIKINELKEGMKNVDIIAKVRTKYDVREFVSGAREGKVGNFLVEDETGSVRITLWNDLAKKMSEFNEGDIVKIKSSYVRLNNRGFKELHLNDRSSISVNPPGVEIAERKLESKKIQDLNEGDQLIELTGHVVNVFDPTFFEQCPECRKRAMQDAGKFICVEHGEIAPTYSYVVNILLDDGTGTLRVTCWKEVADSLFGSLDVIQSAPDMFDSIKNDVLGSIVKVKGGVRKNSLTGNLDLSAKEVKKDEISLNSIDSIDDSNDEKIDASTNEAVSEVVSEEQTENLPEESFDGSSKEESVDPISEEELVME